MKRTIQIFAVLAFLFVFGKEVFAQDKVLVWNESSWALELVITDKGAEAETPLFRQTLKPGEFHSFPVGHWRKPHNWVTINVFASKGGQTFRETVTWNVLNKVIFTESDIGTLFAQASRNVAWEEKVRQLNSMTGEKAICGALTETRHPACSLMDVSIPTLQEVLKKGWMIYEVRVYINVPEKLDEGLHVGKNFLKTFGASAGQPLKMFYNPDCPKPCEFGDIRWMFIVKE